MSDEMIYEVSNDGVNWLHVTCGEYMLSNYPHRRTRQSDQQKPGAMKATLKLRASALADMANAPISDETRRLTANTVASTYLEDRTDVIGQAPWSWSVIKRDGRISLECMYDSNGSDIIPGLNVHGKLDAHARLLVAAPDMLALLRKAFRYVDDGGRGDSPADLLSDEIRALLARIDGEAKP